MTDSVPNLPLSSVEKKVLQKNQERSIYYPTEKIKTIIVKNFPELGRLTALRFIEWAQKNPGSTVALPTGKTPEHFIRWVTYLLNGWTSKKVVKILEEYGVDPGKKPGMDSFHFIQIDEFYPINSWQHNSFYYYVNKFYFDGFGFDPRKAMLINPNQIGLDDNEKLENIWPGQAVDLTLRIRHPKNILEEKQKKVLDCIDQWCTEYESRIRELGGIGFFLGGIGPDGHIGFNVRGSDHYSTTRLTETNYETQAAAAADLGGIEISRKCLVITIGLATITYSADTTAIIIAAGEAKAPIVKQAIELPKNNQYPATVLQQLKNAAFYITRGAAKLLEERQCQQFARADKLQDEAKTQIVTDLSLEKQKRLNELVQDDFQDSKVGMALLERLKGNVDPLLKHIEAHYQELIIKGVEVHKNEVFLHTAPHHDDIMLAYLPYLIRLMREQSNTHYFNYLTSGFNAVTNSFMLRQTENAELFLAQPDFADLIKEDYFNPNNVIFRNRDVLQYLDGLAANRKNEINEGAARRFLRNLVEVYGEKSIDEFQNRLHLLRTYFKTQYPGKKDGPDVQKLKGMLREWEADILWGYFGFGCESVIHSRLGFYKGDIFTEEPQINRDVFPVLEILKKVHPTIVTVALDPEGSGPDTHYKVLQAISTALKLYREETGRDNIKVWGYRNVWYRFHPAEANMVVPVTLTGMAVVRETFLNAFASQADASFPSHEYDGPFSGLAKIIQVEQYRIMKSVLGRDFFYHNSDSRIRSTRGFVFLKEMELEEFFRKSRELQKSVEDV